jgi:hypothetical protein
MVGTYEDAVFKAHGFLLDKNFTSIDYPRAINAQINGWVSSNEAHRTAAHLILDLVSSTPLTNRVDLIGFNTDICLAESVPDGVARVARRAPAALVS